MKIDRRNLLLISVVLLVVGIIGFWVPYKNSKNLPYPTDSSGKADIIVKYTLQGFEPRTLTVKVGTTVGWINPSERPLWVASDPHPTHTDLKGFDSLKVIFRELSPFSQEVDAHGAGFYSYTFTKVGVWKYHNHVNPSDRGTIIVTEQA